MKHFFIEIIYKAPIEKIDEVRERHRAFLEKGYETGMILMSGPQVPRTGGVIIARGNSMEEVFQFFENDPYQKEKAAEYKFLEFNPVHFQNILKEWI